MSRPRKPDELHVLQGTFRADRHGDPTKSVVASGEPVMPDHLNGEAFQFWEAHVPGLVAAGLARSCDAPALTALCEWWATYRIHMAKLQEGSEDRGAAILAGIAWDKVMALSARFGLTPLDRTKLRAEAKGKGGVPTRKREAK